MARLQRTSGRSSSIAEAVVVLGQAILFGSLTQAGCQLSTFFSRVVTMALQALSSVILSFIQAGPSCAGGHDLLFQGLLKIPVSFWTLISALAGAA